MGALEFNDAPTGVIYGFLRDLAVLQDELDSTDLVFCFDYGRSLRYVDLPSYKASRNQRAKEAPREEQITRKRFRQQVDLLRDHLLRGIGFRNIFLQEGYEADDIIASVVRNTIPKEDMAVVVSADKDLYQVLREKKPVASLYNPATKRWFTIGMFHQTYGIEPGMWCDVKARSGCKTDDIPGIPGIGDITAAAYIRGALKPGKKFDAIVWGTKIYKKNLHLVTLPYPGVRTDFELREDRVTIKKWKAVCAEFGLRSIRHQAPIRRKP